MISNKRNLNEMKKIKLNDDPLSEVLKQQKEEQKQQEGIQELANKQRSTCTIYPNLAFEKQNVVKWWEYEMKDQLNFQENKCDLIRQFYGYMNNNKNI